MSTHNSSWLATLIKHLPALLWAGLIYWLSAQSKLPTASITWLDFILKHGAHIFVYAVLYGLLSWAQQPKRILPLILTFLYALSDEFHQSFTPYRVMSFMDIVFDSLGALIGYFFCHDSRSTTTDQ